MLIKNKLKVLVVDDFKYSSEILEQTLKKFGIISVDIAKNGQEAIELSKKNDYCVIFMDSSCLK